MPSEHAIINPVKGRHPPNPGDPTVMVGTRTDFNALRGNLGFSPEPFQRIFSSRMHAPEEGQKGCALAGPMVGAPYAVMILEQLIAWGAERIVFFGWCGSISETVGIGDIILPTSGIVDEGTSIHYNAGPGQVVKPPGKMTESIAKAMEQLGISGHLGRIWTTDAVFRETGEKVENHRQNRALGVEMEVTGLMNVSRFRGVEFGAILVVSDELFGRTWQPGFKDRAFKDGRREARRLIRHLSRFPHSNTFS